jgi:glycerate kinase
MKYLVAVDSFKDSLSSLEVGRAIRQGILRVQPDAEVQVMAMADGGEGTVEALLHANEGREIEVIVHNPLMEPIKAKYAGFETNGLQYAFIECAQSCGLTLIPKHKRNPMVLNTFGLGEQIKDAIRQGYRHIILSLGGSATNDAGIGMLQALGWEFFDENNERIDVSGNPLLRVHSMSDEQIIPELSECKFTVACDVTNPFYGPKGAAHIFARQKGANEEQVLKLDDAMRRFADILEKLYLVNVQDIPGSGAAGGLGGTIVVCLGARRVSGVETVMELIHLEERIKSADVVITGEGSLDNQSLMGKVPIGVAKLAKEHGKPVIGIAGRIDTELDAINEYLDAAFSIQTECRSLEAALEPEVAFKQAEVTSSQIARLIQRITNRKELNQIMGNEY